MAHANIACAIFSFKKDYKLDTTPSFSSSGDS